MRANQKKKILKELQNWAIKMTELIYINVVSFIILKVYNEFL